MPNLLEIASEIHPGYNSVRLRYLEALHKVTGRNIIVYYSGWLQKPDAPGTELNDMDMHGFMAVINGLERSKGLDLVLHTEGGDATATEKLVDYLRSMFNTDIRVIVPHLAMSAGTMIACAAKTILMGKHSGLGPIDPQIMGFSADGVVREFRRAYEEIKKDPIKIHLWGPIIAQHHPSMITECEQVVEWGNDMVREWLETGMFKSESAATRKGKVEKIVKELADNSRTKLHSRHLSAEFCKKLGLQVEMIEKDQRLQDAVLSVHHACSLTLMRTPTSKLIMNHEGINVAQRID